MQGGFLQEKEVIRGQSRNVEAGYLYELGVSRAVTLGWVDKR